MPELPEVEAVRRMLERATRGARIDRVELRRPDLRRPFPADFVSRLTGHTIQSVSQPWQVPAGRRSAPAKRSSCTSVCPGDFRTERPRSSSRTSPPADPHDHVVIVLSSGVVVTFNDPRRFGLMDLIRANDEHEALARDGAGAARTTRSTRWCWRARARESASRSRSLLLDQRLVAGVGNIYASEALHHAGLSPRRRASTIATPAGAPREAAFTLAAAIKVVLRKSR